MADPGDPSEDELADRSRGRDIGRAVADQLAHSVLDLLVGIGDQLLLGAEVVVDRRLGDVGLPRDVGDPDLLVAAVGDNWAALSAISRRVRAFLRWRRPVSAVSSIGRTTSLAWTARRPVAEPPTASAAPAPFRDRPLREHEEEYRASAISGYTLNFGTALNLYAETEIPFMSTSSGNLAVPTSPRHLSLDTARAKSLALALLAVTQFVLVIDG